MSEWKEYKLGELIADKAAELQTGPFGTMLNASEYVSKGTPVIAVQDIGENKLVYHKFVFVDESTAQRLSRYRVQENDIIFGRKGAVERRALIKKQEEGWLQGSDCIRLRFFNKVDPIFASYQFGTNYYQEWMFQNAGGATMPSLNQSVLKELPIRFTNLNEQRAIASILSSLDDKIDLLHRQNATLEKMAETLFRQWFVEEAKEDWEEGKVSDFALHFKDSIQPQKKQSTSYCHYSIPSFDNGRNPINELGAEIQSNKYKVPENCILFSKLNPHKDKRVWLLQNEVEENAICSTEFQVVFPKNKQHLYFLYGWLTLNENYNEIASGVGGTSGSHQRIDPKAIYEFQCPLIADSVIENLNIKVEPLFKKQVINQTQIRTLTALRDTLLPKLMSGEVRVENNAKTLYNE
jgi:type I restriction enzyme S subunit